MEKTLKKIAFVIMTVSVALYSCKSTQGIEGISSGEQRAFDQKVGDTITIVSNKTEYEIIIIEPGFNFWLQSIAKPEGYYSQSFLENRNRILVSEWNRRVLLPQQYDPQLYELQIAYEWNIDYGYDVNYKLYNYFVYFQRKYRQQLGPFVPRI